MIIPAKKSQINTPTVEDLVAWICLCTPHGGPTELRAFKKSNGSQITYSGLYDRDHLADMGMEAMRLTKTVDAVYFLPNPIKPDCKIEITNRTKIVRKTTKNEDILCRTALVIDLDPVRPSGMSATEEEKHAALELAMRVKEDLDAAGLTISFLADSGNGYHLWMLLSDIATNDNELCCSLLHCLSKRFSTTKVKVDTVLYNPSRIIKFYGTWGRKGDSTEDRPHRPSKIEKVYGKFRHGAEILERYISDRGYDFRDGKWQEQASEKQSVQQAPFKGTTRNDDKVTRARAYIARMPEAIAGNWGHLSLWRVVLTAIRGFNLSDADARPIIEEYNARCSPPWSDAELSHKIKGARERGRASFGYLLNDDRSLKSKRTRHSQEPDLTHGKYALRICKVRETATGTLKVVVDVLEDGSPVSRLVVSSTAHGIQKAIKIAERYVEDRAEDFINQIVKQSLQQIASPKENQGPTVKDIVAEYVESNYCPSHRTSKGIWFNALGKELDRSGFLHIVNNDLLNKSMAAQELEGVERRTVISVVETELKVMYGDLLATLPHNRPAEDPIHEMERGELADSIIKMWTKVVALKKTKSANGDEHSHNVSLITHLQIRLQNQQFNEGFPDQRWVKIHPGHAAYWRLYEPVNDCGEIIEEPRIVLAMNAELANSTNTKLPDGITFKNLKRVGKKAGLFDELPDMPRHADRGGVRLCILSLSLTDYLLYDPSEAMTPNSESDITPSESVIEDKVSSKSVIQNEPDDTLQNQEDCQHW